MRHSIQRDRALWLAIACLLLLTLAADALTPLGHSVWRLDFLAVGLSISQSQPLVPLFAASGCSAVLALGTVPSPWLWRWRMPVRAPYSTSQTGWHA